MATNHSNLDKQKINEYYKKIVKCECGCEVTRSNLYTHLRSQKHEKLMKKKLPAVDNVSELIRLQEHIKKLEDKIDLLVGKLFLNDAFTKNNSVCVN